MGYDRIDNIHSRLKDLKWAREHKPIDEFLTEFNEFMLDYVDGEFDPDEYFPNKKALKYEVRSIEDNLNTLDLLTRKNPQRSDFTCNIDNIRAAIYSISSLDWVKAQDTYVIDASNISDWTRIKLKEKLKDCKIVLNEGTDDAET